MRESQEAKIKFPENLKYKRLIKRGETRRLAEIAGYTKASVYEVLNGRRRMTLNFQKAFLEFLKEKESVVRAMGEAATNE